MNLERIRRIKRLREFELEQAQMAYAGLLNELARLEGEIEGYLRVRAQVIGKIREIKLAQEYNGDDLRFTYGYLVYVEDVLSRLHREKEALLERIELARRQMLERKVEKDITEKLESKAKLELLSREVALERKELEENALQRYRK